MTGTVNANRLTKDDGTTLTTSVYDAANRLSYSETTGGRTTFTHDADGNRTRQETPAGDLTTYVWDPRNRNVEVELPSGVIVTCVYNGDHLKVERDDGTDVRRFLYDFKDMIVETDDTGTVERRLIYKHAGPPNQLKTDQQLTAEQHQTDQGGTEHAVRKLTHELAG